MIVFGCVRCAERRQAFINAFSRQRDIVEHNERLRRMRWRYHFAFVGLFIVFMFTLALKVVTTYGS